MLRLYCPALSSVISAKGAENRSLPDVPLDAAEAHHARRVLRLEVGALVEVFDGFGGIASGRLLAAKGPETTSRADEQRGKRQKNNSAASPKHTSIRIERFWTEPPLRPAIEVAAAIPKGSHADTMVEQLSQAGADRLIPLTSARTVVEPGEGKLERFGRAAVESAKQCGRPRIMTVAKPTTMADVLRQNHDLKLIASLGEQGEAGEPGEPAQRDIIARQLRGAAKVLIMIGPEGGWTEDEERQARQAGCLPWRIGPYVLRIEAAAVVAVALARYLTLEHAS